MNASDGEMRPPRPDVCIVTSSGADGGVEKCTREIARFLAERGKRVTILATGGDFYSQYLCGVPNITVLKDLPGSDRNWSLRRIVQAARLFSRMAPRSVLLSHPAVFHFNNCALAARLAGVENVVSVLYSPAAYARPRSHSRHWGMPGIGWWWHKLRMQIRLVIELSHAVLFATSQHADDFHRAYELPPRNGWIVPHLGADTREFRPRPDQRERIRRQYGVGEDEMCIVYAGRLSHEKGPDLLIRALGRLRPDVLAATRTIVVGSGPMREELQREIDAGGLAGRARLTGWIDDLAGLLSAADVAVVPSRLECFGLSLVEAMSAGCAVVATGVGGMKEIVVDGESGCLVEPENPEMLAEKLTMLLEDRERRDRFGRSARDRVLRLYSKDNVLQMMAYILKCTDDPQAVPARWTHRRQRAYREANRP